MGFRCNHLSEADPLVIAVSLLSQRRKFAGEMVVNDRLRSLAKLDEIELNYSNGAGPI
jgi:hypothetical protein